MTNNDTAVKLSDIEKSFKVYRDKGYTIRDRLLTRGRSAHSRVQVLKGVSFSVRKGEAVGLIGENGCGKSTVLKIINRIIYPDSGSVIVNGRVSSLLELGAGFHPELSGRENIYTNAAILGLSRQEIDARFQAIVDFSELWDSIDNPVRTYSSGMYMRLAFSVAINVNADILLIDEILAVGDRNFQHKCFGRLRELKQQNVTIIIVTHDAAAVEDFCSRAIWINDGRVAADGRPAQVVGTYNKYMVEKQLLVDQRQLEEQRKAELARKDFTAEDIVQLYLKLLGRNPESEKTIESYFDAFDRKRDVESSIRDSAEYRTLIRSGKAGQQADADSMLTRDDIISAYQTWLKRDPESENTIATYRNAFRSMDELIRSLQSSPEYHLLERYEKMLISNTGGNAAQQTVRITQATLKPLGGAKTLLFGKPAELEIEFSAAGAATEEVTFNVEAYTPEGTACVSYSSRDMESQPTHAVHTGKLFCHIPEVPLLPGKYRVFISAEDSSGKTLDYKRIDCVVESSDSTSNAACVWEFIAVNNG